MSIFFRRSRRIAPKTTASVSKAGLSASRRFGPLSVSTRGRGTIRLGKGLGFRFKL